jgi:hypothetical protein
LVDLITPVRAQSQEFERKCAVTENLQRRVVDAFLDDLDNVYYDTEDEGLSFLRGHVGNFPVRLLHAQFVVSCDETLSAKSHYEELKECAQYVKQTANCVVGPLRSGSRVDLSSLHAVTLVNPTANVVSECMWLLTMMCFV